MSIAAFLKDIKEKDGEFFSTIIHLTFPRKTYFPMQKREKMEERISSLVT